MYKKLSTSFIKLISQSPLLVYALGSRGGVAVLGKKRKDPRRGTVGPEPFGDQADTSLHGLCKAVKSIKKCILTLEFKNTAPYIFK